MSERIVRPSVDMRAVARVASRVDLVEIRLVELSAERSDGPEGGSLEPSLEHTHAPVRVQDGAIQIASVYEFKIASGQAAFGHARAVYHLFYQLDGHEPVAEEDLKQFASANGPYHSWPFVRELIFGMTARMGFPPFTLPVLSFAPPRPKAQASKPAGRAQ
jgi:hypothetical protein